MVKTYIHKGKKHKGRIPRKLKRKHKRSKIALWLGIGAIVFGAGLWAYNKFVKGKVKEEEKQES